jgi:hypothetical protein
VTGFFRSSWGKNPDADTDTKSVDVSQYQITVDEKKLPSMNTGPKEEATERRLASSGNKNFHD